MNGRVTGLREAFTDLACDAFFSVSPPANQYFSGFITSFEEISSGLVVCDGEALFLTDSRYTEQAQTEVTDFEIQEIKGDLLERSGERLKELGVEKVLYDPVSITVDELNRLSKAYPGALVPDKAVVPTLRAVKSPEEIETIRRASELAESVLADVTGNLEPGIPERELAARIEYEFKKRGAAGAAFDTIALFGPRSSLPHGIPGDWRLERGDVVLLDLGCRLGGYCSDLTRTYAFGTIPADWFEEVYGLVLTAQQRALETVRAGVTAKSVDSAARSLIDEGGYGGRFRHSVGHGVGVEIHEAPRMSPESKTVLKPGMVVTVEPGVYVPGKGGVRIEDLVAITEEGCEILTNTPKALKVLSQ